MKEFLITLFLGAFGVHRFMKKQYAIGVVYLLTIGLFGIGWAVDSITAFVRMVKGTATTNENEHIFGGGVQPSPQSMKTLVKSFDTEIVGTFAKCDLDSDDKRENVIMRIKPKNELRLEFWRYKGDPAYYVVFGGNDAGCIRAGLAKILYEEYSDCEFKVTAIKREMDDRDNLTYKIRIDVYK